MQKALKAIEDMSPSWFDDFAWDVYRHPEHYRLVPASSGVGNIYIMDFSNCNLNSYDKHFWVDKKEVDKITRFYANLNKEPAND